MPTYPLRRYQAGDHLSTIELRTLAPFLAWVLVLAWYLAAPTAVSAVGLAALTGLLVFAWLWARAMARGVSARRQLHYAAVQVGDALEERLTLVNTSRLPALWAEFVDRSDLPGYSIASVRAVEAGAERHWRAEALCTRRGLFTLGPWELRLGDPLGFFLVRQVYAQRQELLVYPPLAPLPPHLQPHNSLPGDHRRLRQPLPAETLNAVTTRPYAPGDPLRHIHWPSTARHEALFARVFEPEATSTLWLLPDFDPRVHRTLPAATPGDPDDSTEELMVLLTASLADHLLRRRLAVGLLAHTGPVSVVRPQAGKPHLWPLLRALAPLHATCPFDLSAALAQLQAPLSARHRLVVITPSLDPAWPRALRALGQRRGLDCLLIDPTTFGGAGAVEACVLALAEQGVGARVVRRGELAAVTPVYGALRRWEFMTLGTGRAVAVQTPRRALDETQAVPGAAIGAERG
jgi:uncharacterized protein (DUF58 family)